jgi:putative methionine-R-sulfoxide reductase with GAF domain
MMQRISTFWLMVFGLMLTSAITLGLMSASAIQTTGRTVEAEQISQLRFRAEAHASAINERLLALENATQLLASQAKLLMLGDELSAEEIRLRLEKYQRDDQNIYGSDRWYQEVYKPRYGDNHVSNAYLNKNTPLTPQLERTIAATEELDPLFRSIHESNLHSQWLYLTLPSGMMRLYPWTESASYGADWQPQTIFFFTVADRTNNPDRKSVWTAPYNDYAGAGLMVTNSYPIYDGDTLIGVMSNDVLIKSLQEEVLGFKVGDKGLGFLLDKDGNVIAHRKYVPENIPVGAEVNIKLAEHEPYMADVVTDMLENGEGTKTVTDTLGVQWVVVYAPVPATNWHLALMQPRNEIVQPATDIADQVKYWTVVLVLLALAVSIIIARWISQPVTWLSKKARMISSSVDAMDASIDDEQSGTVTTDIDTSKVRGTREIYNLSLAFGEMVAALHKRINELGSIYVLGQSIAAAMEYEKTLDTVLSAVERTVRSDFVGIYITQGDGLHLEVSSTPKADGMTEVLAGQILEHKHSLLVEGLQSENVDAVPDVKAYMTEKNVFSLLVMPLVMDEKPMGLVFLENRRREAFTGDDQRRLNRLAALASIALNNAIQVRRREQELKRQIRELKIEIDQKKKQKDVSQIVESDYFQALQKRASEIRVRSLSRKGKSKP